jgi:hypothetical protein
MVSAALGLLSEREKELLRTPSGHGEFGFILDPSCGVGSLLAETVRQASSLVADTAQARTEWLSSAAENILVGIDKSERMFRLATCNLALFGFPVSRLNFANALAKSGDDGKAFKQLDGKVRLILTNPPFGAAFPISSLTGYTATTWNVGSRQTTIDSEILFLERYIDWLMPGGHLVAVVPDSVLTNKGIYAALRGFLAQRASIEFVVSLPHVTFASAGTSTKTSILCLKRTDGRGTGNPVYFGVCRSLGFDVVTRGSVRRKVQTGISELPEICRELLGEQTSSSLGARLKSQPSTERWDAPFHVSAAKVNSGGTAARIKLSAIATLITDRENPARRGGGSFPYIEISDVDPSGYSVTAKDIACENAPSRARKLVQAGDVLISTVRPDRRTVGVVPQHLDRAICSTGFAVLRPSRIHSLLLAKLMTTDDVTSQLCAHSSGVAYPVFDEAILPSIDIPSIEESVVALNQVARTATEALERAREAMSAFDAAVADALKAK